MTDLVSDHELEEQLAQIGVALPRTNVLLRSVRRGSLSLRDAVYFTLLEALERRRHAQKYGDRESQEEFLG